jgi:hypothetical protein
MKNGMTKIILVMVFLLAGCASNLKNYSWYQKNNTGTSFEKAYNECLYDIEKLGKGTERYTIMAVYGMQHPLLERCMARYGYEWKKDEK